MKRFTLSACLLALVCGLGMTNTASAQYFQETSWSSGRTSNSAQSWSTGPGGSTFQSRDTFEGFDQMKHLGTGPGYVQGSQYRNDFGGFNQACQVTRPVSGGRQQTGFQTSGGWQQQNGSAFRVDPFGGRASGFSQNQGFMNQSGFQQFDGWGGSNRQQFNHSSAGSNGNVWQRGW